MDEETEQFELVSWLRSYLTRGPNPTIKDIRFRNPMGLPEPEAIDDRQPDLVGRVEPGDKLLIGLARMGATIGSEESIEDYRVLGNYREPEAEVEAAFVLAVPDGRKAEAEATLEKVGLDAEQFCVIEIGNFSDQ